jgi:hypothetical protein
MAVIGVRVIREGRGRSVSSPCRRAAQAYLPDAPPSDGTRQLLQDAIDNPPNAATATRYYINTFPKALANRGIAFSLKIVVLIGCMSRGLVSPRHRPLDSSR